MLGNDTVAVGFPCGNRPQFLWVGKSPKVVQSSTQDTSGRVGEEAFICIRGGRGIICKRSRYFWLHVPGSVPARPLGELWPFRHSAKSKEGGGGEEEREGCQRQDNPHRCYRSFNYRMSVCWAACLHLYFSSPGTRFSQVLIKQMSGAYARVLTGTCTGPDTPTRPQVDRCGSP